jgi:hypothetical protein
MSDPAAEMRHEQHEGTFADHEARIGKLEGVVTDEVQPARIWRTGNGTPRRGAEERIHRVEEGAVMRNELDRVAEVAVRKYLTSLRGVLQTAAPYVLLLAGVVYALITGKPPVTR